MVSKKSRLMARGLLLAGVPVFFAQADDTPPEIQITAQKLEASVPAILEKEGTRVDVVTADQIAKAGYVDVTESLAATVPGLFIQSQSGPFDYVNVSLQGSRTEDVLWLVDGVRINNRLYGGTTPLDTMPASIVDNIEVLEGGQALFYGTQAIAGAINIVTKPFTDTPSGALSIGGDTNESGHVDGYYSDSIGKNHFLVYINGDASQGYKPFSEQAYQPSAAQRDRGYQLVTLGGKYAYDFTESLRFSTTVQQTFAKLDLAQPYGIAKDYNDRNETIATGKIDYTPSDDFQLYAKGYYHNWDSHNTDIYSYACPYGNGVSPVCEDNGFWGYHDAGANVMGRVAAGPWLDAILGYDYQTYSGRDSVLVINQQSESVNAIFGQLATSSNLSTKGTLAAGFRYNAPSDGPSDTVWNVNGKYSLTSNLFIQGSAGTSFRIPTAEELFANDPEDERGDPNLKPEQSVYGNASIGGFLDEHHLKWELVGFARNITNLIDFASFDADTEQAVFGNVAGQVHVRGGEVVLTADYAEWSATASYTRSHSTEDGDQQIDGVPTQEAKLTADYHPKDKPFGLNASIDYVGNIYQSNMCGDGTICGGRWTYGNYPVVNLAGRYYVDDDHHQTVTLALKNLFDRRYATGLGNGQTDAGGEYSFAQLAPPLTASIRYSYRF